MIKMNRKGAQAIFGTNFVMAIFLGVVFIIFLTGGGASIILDITKFIKNIPTLIWVFLGGVLLLKVIGGKK